MADRKIKTFHSYFSVCHFSVRSCSNAIFNFPLQFWEKAIPKADRSPVALIAIFISNHVNQELKWLAENGTPLGYLIRMSKISALCHRP
jgi:hypothetical protein